MPTHESVKLAPIHKINDARVVERESEILRLCANKKILHIGCCDFPYTVIRGENLLHLKLSKVTKNDNLWGIDTSEQGCSLLRDMEFDHILCGSTDQFISELENQSFDIILAGEVIEHVDNPGHFLNSITPIMKNNTELIITTVNATSIYNFIYALIRKEKVHPDHNFYFSFCTIKHLMEKCDLNPIEIYFYKVKNRFVDKMLSIFSWLSAAYSDGIIVKAVVKRKK